MTALCVDDEALLLDSLEWAVGQSPDISEVAAFDDELEALDWAAQNRPDVAFLDVQMHSIGGLELAERLRALYPALPVIFCTGYREYALDAFQLHASGYLMKPIRPDAVQRELDHLRGSTSVKPLLTVRCFGSFEVCADGVPLHFRRSKTKEMFAYLVDRRGAIVSSRELCALLWENDAEDGRNLNYMHHLLGDLRKRLKEVGAENVLRSPAQGYSVDPSLLDCDYYRFLDGDPDALRQFTGEYMTNFSWAEYTCSYLLTKA